MTLRVEAADEKERLALDAAARAKEKLEKECKAEEEGQTCKMTDRWRSSAQLSMKVVKTKKDEDGKKIETTVDGLAKKTRQELIKEQRELMIDERVSFEEERVLLRLAWEKQQKEEEAEHLKTVELLRVQAGRAHDLAAEKARLSQMTPAVEAFKARGLGVLVCLNDEIHAAREVSKTSTARLQTFRSPDFGVLGHADGDRIVFYRKSLRRHNPDTEFDIRTLDALPRVEIAYHYAGSDGMATRAFIQGGAKGIVGAAFAPGLLSPEENIAMKEAVAAGIKVVMSSRAGSGRTFGPSKIVQAGFLRADNLNPQKARILLALALTKTTDSAEIQRMFDQY